MAERSLNSLLVLDTHDFKAVGHFGIFFSSCLLGGRQVFSNALNVGKVAFLVTLKHRTEAVDTVLISPLIPDLLYHIKMLLK